MKRLLKISLDKLINAAASIIVCLILSIFVDKSLFSLLLISYPIFYLSNAIFSIFSTGANISKVNGNKNDVLSGMTFGIIFSLIAFGFILFNVDNYINFIGIKTSSLFVIYIIIFIFLQGLLNIVLAKLYYEEKNKLANIYSGIFYSLNTLLILLTSILFENAYLIIVPTIIVLFVFTSYLIIKSYEKFKLSFNILKWIKYDSTELVASIFLGIAFLFGINNAVSYGEKYALALTLVATMTDVQWDVFGAISVVAKIDISKNSFDYKKHLKNAYLLVALIVISIFVLFLILLNVYKFNIVIVLIYLSFHVFDFLITPLFEIKTVQLQLKSSAALTTTNKLVARIVRLILSFLKTPYCTVIAQVLASMYQIITVNIMYKNAKKKGTII